MALNKHRHTVHRIPLPPDPANDRPQSRVTPEGEMDIVPQTPQTRPEGEAVVEAEWFMWKFSEEEEARRRAYLPL